MSYTIKKLGGKPIALRLGGEFMVIVGWFTLAFYGIFRLLAIETLAQGLYGTTSLKLFTLMWYLSKSGFIAATCMFAAGIVLYRYGRRLERTIYGRDKPAFAKFAKKTADRLDPERKYKMELSAKSKYGDFETYQVKPAHNVRQVNPTRTQNHQTHRQQTHRPAQPKKQSPLEYESIFSR